MSIKRRYRINLVPRGYVDDLYNSVCIGGFINWPFPNDKVDEKVFVPEFLSENGDWTRFTQKPLSMWFMEPPEVFFESIEEAESFIRKEHEEFVKWHEKYDAECVEEFEL